MDQKVSRYLTRTHFSRINLIIQNNAPNYPCGWSIIGNMVENSELSSKLDWDARMDMQQIPWPRFCMESVSQKGYSAGDDESMEWVQQVQCSSACHERHANQGGLPGPKLATVQVERLLRD